MVAALAEASKSKKVSNRQSAATTLSYQVSSPPGQERSISSSSSLHLQVTKPEIITEPIVFEATKLETFKQLYFRFGDDFFRTNSFIKQYKPGSKESVEAHAQQTLIYFGDSLYERQQLGMEIANAIDKGDREAIVVLNSLVNYLVNQSKEFWNNPVDGQYLLPCGDVLLRIYRVVDWVAKEVTKSLAQEIYQYSSLYPKVNIELMNLVRETTPYYSWNGSGIKFR